MTYRILTIALIISLTYLSCCAKTKNNSEDYTLRIKNLMDNYGQPVSRQRRFISGSKANGSFAQSIERSTLTGQVTNVYVTPDSWEVYITPKYHKEKLEEVNRKVNEKIQDYKVKIENNKTKTNKLEKYNKKITKLEAELLKPHEFDSFISGNSVIVLAYNIGTQFYSHSIVDNSDNLSCKAIKQKVYEPNKDEKDYLKDVYGWLYLFSGSIKKVISTEYPSSCFQQSISLSEKFVYKSSKNNDYFSHTYKLHPETKALVKMDF